ncbi:cytochrome c oxidase copper chaperone [Ciona intestinalis]
MPEIQQNTTAPPSQCPEGMSKPAKKRPIGKDGKPLKPCCCCPETKTARDECIVNRGEEACGDLIQAHKQCLRDLGFNI